MPEFQDITGHRFGRLVAESVHLKASRNPRRPTSWLCQCDCGRKRVVNLQCLKSGDTQSCGCLWRERISSHGHTVGYRFSPTYTSWKCMIRRCTDPNFKQFKDYGGRGIEVCDRWRSFENFLEDMGPRPPGWTIERVNNDQGYSPDNCKWLSLKDQWKNKRSHGGRRKRS